jgi:hypothetical protein
MTRPSHPPCLHHPNNTGWRVQTMQLLIMQFSPTSCHYTVSWNNIGMKNKAFHDLCLIQ